MSPPLLIATYCVLVALASMAGGWLPVLFRLTHLQIQLMMSLVSGLMLGVAMLHLMPHSIEYSPSLTLAAGCMLAGLLVMFFLLRIFHVHCHDDLSEPAAGGCNHAHAQGHEHDHAQHGEPSTASRHQPVGAHLHPAAAPHRLSWLGLFVGLAVHSLLDGVALGASVVAEGGGDFPLLGLGTFLAVVLHKPLDALSITSLMSTSGWSPRSQTVANLGFALACPLGTLLFWFGIAQVTADHNAIVGCALAFSAGFFVCIALSDLLPEVAFHSHDRTSLSVALLLGVALAVGIEWLHGGAHHVHSTEAHEHDHVH